MGAKYPISFGRYQLVERLAVGGMAELYLAQISGDHGFAKRVVIKRILPHLAGDPQFTQMFIAEAKITARLSHPKIAQTHRLGREDGNLYIEMEYVDGLDVLAMLRECAHRRLRLPPEVSAYVIKEVLDGLDYAHKLTDEKGQLLGVVHRDVSPSNVLVSRRGNVKLVDFGIAHAVQSDQGTQAGTLKGKYGYMSPEQVLGEGVTARSDLFSVGVVLAEMLMGRRLFAAPNELDVLLMVRDVKLGRLERYGSHIPEGLLELVHRALRKAPEERFRGAAEFRDAIDEWMFENRHRVAPAMVGEFIESLYADAHERRRSSLENEDPPAAVVPVNTPLVAALAGEAGNKIRISSPSSHMVPPPSGVPAPAAPEASLAGAATEPLLLGSLEPIGGDAGRRADIPVGGLGLTGAGGALSEEEIEIAFGVLGSGSAAEDAASGGAADAKGGAPPAPASEAKQTARIGEIKRAPAAKPAAAAPAAARPASASAPSGSSTASASSSASDEELVLSEEIVVDLQGMDGLGTPGTSTMLGAEESESTIESIPSGALTDDDGIPISVDEPEQSLRFPTISAAVASVRPLGSPPMRDPASRDFDDSDVSGLVEVEDVRSGRHQLPSPEELARAPKPAPPQLEEIVETPAQSGELGVTSPIRMLFQLVSSRADGLLVVSVGAVRKEIYLKDGIPTYVSSNVASELFGAYLVQQAALSSGELDMALAMMPHFGGKLGDTLVGLGLMKPLDVFRMLTRQVRAKLIDVCTWSKGTFTWYPWRENHRESFPLDLDPYEVLGAGAMALPEDVLWHWSEKVAGQVPRMADRPGLRPEQFKIGELGRRVLGGVWGERKVSELLVEGIRDVDRLDMLRALFLFLETGVLVDAHR